MRKSDYAMNRFNAEMKKRVKSDAVRVTVEERGEVSEFELDSVIVVGIKHNSFEETANNSNCTIQGTALGKFDDTRSHHIANGLIGLLRSARLRLTRKYMSSESEGGQNHDY